jgi:membrane peptidoglycan carboxypeptidase
MIQIRKARHRNPFIRLLRAIFFGFAWTIAVIAAIAVAGSLIYYYAVVPDVNDLLKNGTPASSQIFDRNGQLIYEVYGDIKRTPVPFNTIPDNLRKATIAIEDKNFYSHGAVSLPSMVRAIWVNYKTGEIKQGASTITQQFIKAALLNSDRTFQRKILEAVLAQKLESHNSKDEILSLYLNTIPYGRNVYGVEAASQSYFGKPVRDLSLAECAYLAALPQAPSLYNPLGANRQLLDDRRDLVLKAMLEQGYITQLQYEGARAAKVEFKAPKIVLKYPHFVFWVENYVEAKYGDKILNEGGLKIYTTLDPKLQDLAEKVVADGVVKTASRYNAHNAALVAVDPKTQQVLAMVGGKDYFGVPEPAGCTPGKNCEFEPDVNTAVAQRQPGSSFKIYDYLTAFKPENAYSPASVVLDAVRNFGDYVPHDYDGGQRGRVPIRSALGGSLNIPAVQVVQQIGVDNVIATARDLGVTSPMVNCGLPLALGACEIRLVDHVTAASVLANGGVNNGPTPILRIDDKDGNTLEQYRARNDQVADPQAVYELTNILSDNKARAFIFGDKTPLTLDDGTPQKNPRPVAAKTGTTQQ